MCRNNGPLLMNDLPSQYSTKRKAIKKVTEVVVQMVHKVLVNAGL